MNLPNKLTLSRLLMVVVITLLYFIFGVGYINLFVILALFILASITDYFDGKIARKYNLVTGFGKLMDPLADKLLVICALVILIDLEVVPYIWLLIIVIARELMVSGIRLVALEQKGDVIAADILGKLKTLFQMVSISMLLFYSGINLLIDTNFIRVFYIISLCLFYVSMVLLVISGIEIFIKNRKYFKIK